MFNKVLLSSSVALGMLTLTACSTMQPIQTIQNQPIPSGLSNKQIQQAMMTAGFNRHWVITPAAKSSMVGKLNWHGHYVKVTIPYTSSKYAIVYQDSNNLDYKQGQIHRAYNKWTNMLNDQIQTQLAFEAQKNLLKKS